MQRRELLGLLAAMTLSNCSSPIIRRDQFKHAAHALQKDQEDEDVSHETSFEPAKLTFRTTATYLSSYNLMQAILSAEEARGNQNLSDKDVFIFKMPGRTYKIKSTYIRDLIAQYHSKTGYDFYVYDSMTPEYCFEGRDTFINLGLIAACKPDAYIDIIAGDFIHHNRERIKPPRKGPEASIIKA